MVEGFVVLDFVCGSSGLGVLFWCWRRVHVGVPPGLTAGILSKVRPCDYLPRKQNATQR